MKDKFKPVDLNLLSTYMGRSLTLVITVFVIVVAVGAIVGRGGGAQRNIIDIWVDEGQNGREEGRYDPLRALLSDQTRRTVRLWQGRENRKPGYDLYIMPTGEYLRHAGDLGIDAFYEVKDTERTSDSALLVAKASAGAVDYASLSATDVAFSSPRSVNGFWVPASLLEQRGFRFPSSISELRFEGMSDGASRALLGVVYGSYRLAACRMSELTSLLDRGVIRRGELSPVERVGALPEVVVAASPDQTAYYAKKLAAIDRLLDEIVVPASRRETVGLLKSKGVRGLEPIEDRQIEQARRLLESCTARLGADH
jgi:ABC-type phosphate/phosphonate transport system substrate-binding protein